MLVPSYRRCPEKDDKRDFYPKDPEYIQCSLPLSETLVIVESHCAIQYIQPRRNAVQSLVSTRERTCSN